MSFVNSNYESKLSPTMTENWLVQIFRNDNSSIQTTDTPDLAFSFSATTFDGVTYYPAILNKPTISYSLDLKSFTTKTGNITLNIGNIDLDGTTLLGTLGKEYINAHVNILSQIDNDATAANALQIFSGKVSSFGYRSNTIVMNIISTRPFQNVSIPQGRTSTTDEQYNNKLTPLVYGEYTASTGKTFNGEVYACPFHKNDGENFLFLVPEDTSGSEDLEFYDKSLKRFLPLTDTIISPSNGIVTVDGAKVLKVPKTMKREATVFPDDVPSATFTTNTSLTSGALANIIDNDANTSATISNTTGFVNAAGGFWIKLILPQVTGKVTGFTINLEATYTQEFDNLSGANGLRVTLQDTNDYSPNSFAHCFGSPSRDRSTSGTISLTDTNVFDYIEDNNATNDAAVIPNEAYLFFDFDAVGGSAEYINFSAVVKELSFKVTVENDLDKEPVASSNFNAGVDKVYLGRDILSASDQFTGHTTATTTSNLNNPVSIHRQLLHDIVDIVDFVDNTDISDSGFLTVAELRDSDTTSPLSSTHWKTQFQSYEQESLEGVLNKLQYEGCFFFQFSPQAQQTALTGVSPLRYFTIDNGTPTADIALSQNDISGYELGITEVGDLETNIVVNYKKHPAENQYLKQATYTASTGDGQKISHNVVFEQASNQKQEFNLDYVFESVDVAGSERNDNFINFRSSLFGDYKTTISIDLVNPEKYGMLQVGNMIDFSSILFQDLGEPFSSISATFDSYVAMPTNLFKDTWSNKRFIITNLKRGVGKVSVQCRQV